MKRKTAKIPGYPGIYRILNWDKVKRRWVEPKRGKKFGVKVKGSRKHFNTFIEAKEYRIRAGDDRFGFEQLGMKFVELVELWENEWLPNKSISTQVRYKSYLKHFTRLMSLEVEKITPLEIDRLISVWKNPNYLALSNPTRCSYDHELSVLRVILNFYVSRINRNFRLPFLKDHRDAIKIREKFSQNKDMTVEDVRSFIGSLKSICLGTDWEPVYFLALVQYSTFTRVQEAAAFHYEDFDLNQRVVHVRRKIVWPRGGGHRNYIADGTKANSGKTIPMSKLAEEVFGQWTQRSNGQEGLMFRIRGDIIPYRVIEHRYSRALRMAGIDQSATHVLRHASLCEYYETTQDLLATKAVAGHTDLKSTTKYAKARSRKLIDNQSKLDSKISGLLEIGTQKAALNLN